MREIQEVTKYEYEGIVFDSFEEAAEYKAQQQKRLELREFINRCKFDWPLDTLELEDFLMQYRTRLLELLS